MIPCLCKGQTAERGTDYSHVFIIHVPYTVASRSEAGHSYNMIAKKSFENESNSDT
jgi:hypothetical protein